jgi:hypothetical protein
MTIDRTEPNPNGRSWAIQLRRPSDATGGLEPTAASASELMFFWNAPVAHVVEYEERQRLLRGHPQHSRYRPKMFGFYGNRAPRSESAP